MSIRLPKMKKDQVVLANHIDMQIRQIDEESTPMIGLKISEDEHRSVVIVLTPENASKLMDGLLRDDVKVFLKVSDERKDVMYA